MVCHRLDTFCTGQFVRSSECDDTVSIKKKTSSVYDCTVEDVEYGPICL